MLTANLDIDSKAIEELYDLFFKEVLIVNRRYQRKLVWSIDEKRALISSIIEAYPIPFITFCQSRREQRDSGWNAASRSDHELHRTALRFRG